MVITLSFRVGSENQHLHQRVPAVLNFLFRHFLATHDRLHIGMSQTSGHRFASGRFSCVFSLASDVKKPFLIHQKHSDPWQAFVAACLHAFQMLQKAQCSQRLNFTSAI